ncbi:centrosomal protein of 63 kDa-like [Chenopodium quinoa]|uniref:centrosomal protein of 63 kDa-like n=1 Tax=Chenopodium quinoa TaxID=63459 RepID=UPI000B777A7C|nr:centrosomal protein of 63 kDa-like [Chenopodium quinoa]
MGFFDFLTGGNKKVKEAKNRISQLEGQLSSTHNDLSSTRAHLERLNQRVEKLTEDNLDRELMIDKLLKLGELQEQFASTKVEALTSKCNLEASRKEEEELKEQLLNRRKIEEDVEMKLRKVIELEKQVVCVNEEVLSTKVDLEASKKEEDMLNEQLLGLEKILEEMEMKLNMVMKLEKELEDTKNKVLTTKGEFEVSKKEENMLKEHLQSCENLHKDMNTKLQKVLDLEKQLRFIRAEGLFVKTSLEGSRKQEERLKKQLFESERSQQDMGMKLQQILKLKNEISSYEAEALSDMASLEITNKEVEELKEKLSLLEKVQQAVVELKLL